MDAIFNKERSDADDFYKLLGCDELSSAEQINTEFKVKARNLHPDKNLDDPKAADEFAKLQRARDVLMDEKKRKEYDFWRRSGLAVPYDTWVSMKDSMQTSLHWAVKAKKEPMIEDNSERYPPNTDEIGQPSISNRQHFTASTTTDETHTDGYDIPKGTEAVLFIYELHRDPEYFPDPEKFDPDHFLTANSAKKHPYAYTPFSAGPRNYIGQKFAQLEEKTVVASILRRYQVESVEPRDKVIILAELILGPEKGIYLKLTHRQ